MSGARVVVVGGLVGMRVKGKGGGCGQGGGCEVRGESGSGRQEDAGLVCIDVA